ncbi:MAG: S24 family peptidase, partial [Acidaminococcaceae bacterium]
NQTVTINAKDAPAPKTHINGVKIPVLGRVVAGVPLEAITDILDYEEISVDMARTGEFFALQIKGDSMTPRICEGDVVIVRKQPTVDSGSLAIVLINGEDATLKQVIVRPDGIMLQAFNPAVYPTHFYTCADIKKLPVTILGKVVELRGRFL